MSLVIASINLLSRHITCETNSILKTNSTGVIFVLTFRIPGSYQTDRAATHLIRS